MQVSGASHRLRALAALSGSLTDALNPDDAANLVERQALTALGASDAILMTLGRFPPPIVPDTAEEEDALHIVHAIGVSPELREMLTEVTLDAPIPLAEVARLGEAVFLATDAELRRYPEWGETMIRGGAHAAAIVPVWANGELRGVLGLSWKENRDFDEDERAFVLTLGVMGAQAIMRAHLRAAERVAREAAEEANRSKTHFLAMVSHELRTPMSAVMGYTELMTEEIYGPITGPQRDHLGRVRESGRHLLALIEDLLDYARLESGVSVVRLEKVSLVDLVEQSLVLVRPIAERKGIRIRIESPDQPIELNTDARKLRQILVNLLANAVKFSEEGEVVLCIRIDELDANLLIHFEVSDQGRGISVDAQPHVFDAYWQEAGGFRAVSGTGLGLPVARSLARLLGGDVELERSVEGVGSTFTVTLPVSYAGQAELAVSAD